jgi:hypothetical protein
MKVKFVNGLCTKQAKHLEEYHTGTYLSIKKVSGHLNFFLLVDI